MVAVLVLAVFMSPTLANDHQEKPPRTIAASRNAVPLKDQEPEKKLEPASLERIIKQLKHEQGMVRLNAAIALGRYPSQAEAAIPDLIELLGDSSDDRIPDAVVATLGKIGAVTIPHLIKAFEKDDTLLRGNVLKVIGELRRAHVEQKEHKGAKKLEQFLLKALEEPGEKVPLQAMNALAANPPRSKVAMSALLEFAKDVKKSETLRGIATLLVGRYGKDAQESVKTLMAFLTEETTPDSIRRSAVNSLAKIAPNNQEFLLVIRKILVNPKEHVQLRWAAARGIGETGTTDKAAIADLVNVLRQLPINSNRNGGSGFIWGVSAAIAKLKPAKDAIPVLLEYAQSDDGSVQRHMFIAIGNMGSEAQSAVPTLIKLARNPENKFVLKDIVTALGNIGPEAKLAIPLLNEIAEKTERPQLKEQVRRALLRIHGP
jgi:HEAT repeat protein